MMRKVLLATVALGGLFTLAATATQAAPATGLHGFQAPASAVAQVDYYWHRHHWHHRRWYHHGWHYWD